MFSDGSADAPRAAPAPAPISSVPRLPDGRGPSLADRLSRLRSDPRFGAVALALVAVLAGWLWYRAGVDDASADPATGAVPSTTTARAASPSPPPASVGVATADPAAGVPTGPATDLGAATTNASTVPVPVTIVVHVAGAVATPGVYRLPAGARVDDAVLAAGGPVLGADVDALNRAQPLIDGQRVGVPLFGETVTGAVGAGAAATGTGVGVSGGTPGPVVDGERAGGGSSSGSAPSPLPQPVNLNTANQAELETLPGVGPSIAGAIMAERDARGGFRSPRDLLDVRGIGESRLAQLEPLVTV